MKSIIYFFLLTVLLYSHSCRADSADVVTGTLPNGLRYVLKSHAHPKNRLSLRMHIATGSLNENENQLGLAHFLEHLAFAGSTHFPNSSIIPTFEEYGMQFALHQNAKTSFNFTIYSLELPNNSEALASQGLLFFADVLDRLTLDEQAIEKERTIILEEKRIYDMAPATDPNLEGSLYSRRKPIGDEKSILSLKKEDFLNYYHAFYRTDNSTIVMVGDMDTAQMHKIIEEKFGQISPKKPVTGNDKKIPPTKAISVSIEHDAHITSPQIRISRILPPTPSTLEQDLVRDLAQRMMKSRAFPKAEIKCSHNPGIYECLELETKSADLSWKKSLNEAMTFLVQAEMYGFKKKELAKEKKQLKTELQSLTMTEWPSCFLADELVDAVDRGDILSCGSELVELRSKLLETITLKQINSWWKKFKLNPYNVKLTLPPSVKNVPSKKALVAAIKKAKKIKAPKYKPITYYKPKKPSLRIVEEIPEAAPIATITEDPESQVTSILLKNGVRVKFRKIEDVPGNFITIHVLLAGGTIEETPETHNFTHAACNSYTFETSTVNFAESIMLRQGFGFFIDLASGEDYLQFQSSANVKETEQLFQFLHVLLKDPKLDANMFERLKKEKLALPQHAPHTLQDYADQVFKDLTLQPTKNPFASLQYNDCQEWMKRIFREAPMGVSIVGNIDAAKVVELAQMYFGSLPARCEISPNTFAERRHLALQPGPYVAHVIRPCEVPATLLVTGYVTHASEDRIMQLIDIVVHQRLLQRARYNEGLIYSIQSSYEKNATYTNYSSYLIKTTCNPENQTLLADSINEELTKLIQEGPTDKELTTAIKIAKHNNSPEGVHSIDWILALTNTLYRNDQETLLKMTPDYDNISVDDIKAFIQKSFLPENRVQITVQGQKLGL